MVTEAKHDPHQLTLVVSMLDEAEGVRYLAFAVCPRVVDKDVA
jgi:hypothetical protein